MEIKIKFFWPILKILFKNFKTTGHSSNSRHYWETRVFKVKVAIFAENKDTWKTEKIIALLGKQMQWVFLQFEEKILLEFSLEFCFEHCGEMMSYIECIFSWNLSFQKTLDHLHVLFIWESMMGSLCLSEYYLPYWKR